MIAAVELTGQRFGRLVACEMDGEATGRLRWWCTCDCGNRRSVSTTHLRTGHTTSCGCAAREAVRARNRASAKHGMWGTPEWEAWSAMLKRCYDPRNKKFPDYGGRGITVFEEWRKDFSAFYSHIGSRPSSQHSLDRIRNEEGYKPGNVRWATDGEQNNNRRSNVTAEIDGEVLTVAQIAARYGLNHSTVLYRLRAGLSGAALCAPPTRSRK